MDVVNLNLYAYSEGDDFFSYDSYVAKGSSQSTGNQELSFFVLPGAYYLRVDLESAIVIAVEYALVIRANGVDQNYEGKVFHHKDNKENYPAILEFTTDMVSRTGFCRVDIQYLGPPASLRVYPAG